MADQRATALAASLRPLGGARVVDFGCGWAELLLRVVGSDPTASGLGIDIDEVAIAYGRSTAAARGLAHRVELQVADVSSWSGERADILLCIGAHHPLGGIPNALAALRSLLRPGGRLVFGAEFWATPPTPEALRALDVNQDAYGSLADLVATAVGTGFRPLAVAEASPQEWDSFESGYAAAWERYLLSNPGAPDADQVRAQADAHRRRFLGGYRGVLGFAYLTLGVPA